MVSCDLSCDQVEQEVFDEQEDEDEEEDVDFDEDEEGKPLRLLPHYYS